MPTLDWIGKKAVVNHHHQVPYHLLKDVPDVSVGDPGASCLLGLDRLRDEGITFRQTPYEVRVS